MTPTSPTRGAIRWLRVLVGGAIGMSLAACADRAIDFDLDETGDDGIMETGTPLTDIPVEEFSCPDANMIIEGVLLPDGTCAACEGECALLVLETAGDAPHYCDDGGSCWCEITPLCSAATPNEEGRCLHGFDVQQWCGEGRPLLAASEVRVAPDRPRADWLTKVPILAVPAQLRAEVRAGWLARAAMEHASVAAFSRFCVQLMGLGAPAELVEAAQWAGLDEARHARIGYAIASQLGDAPVGPDRLELAGLVLDAEPAQVALESILEGCIGETIAAAKMRLLADHAQDPALAQVLSEIAVDEGRHAALAWQALDWMLASFPALEATVREVFSEALAGRGKPTARPAAAPSLAHGVLDPATSDWVSQAVLREVIEPAAAGLLGAPGRSRAA